MRMQNIFLSLLLIISLLGSESYAGVMSTGIPPGSGGGGSVTWPTSGKVVISNGTNTPAGIAPVDGDCLTSSAGAWIAGSCGGGGGGITSVAMTGDGVIFNATVGGSPITSSGTLVPALLTQTANRVLAGPTSGGVTAPTFRALVGADIPNPSASSLGGVQSKAAVTSNFLTSISTSGVPAAAQPAFTDISGTVAAAQLPNPSASSLGGVQSKAAVSNQFLTSISTSGVPTSAQPTTGDISGLGSIASQAASAVAITGGTIDNTTIGATTATTGKFTTVNATTATSAFQIAGANALSLPANDSGGGSIAIGSGALGTLASSAAYQNTAVGYQSLNASMTTAAVQNTAVGYQALKNITQGTRNIALGDGSGGNISTGGNNAFFGHGAGAGNGGTLTGSNNVGVGSGALNIVTSTGASNTVIGVNAGNKITTGGTNTIVGAGVASTTLATGTNNILVGTSSSIDTAGASTSNTINIGGVWTATSTSTTPVNAIAGSLNATGRLSSSKQVYVPAAALTPGTTVAWDLDAAAYATLAPVQNFTLSNPSNIVAGGTYTITITQDGTGSRVITWSSAYKFPGGTKFVLSTAIGAIDTITCYSPDGTTLQCVGQAAFS